ncbi:MAG: hypothetical protein EBT33_07230 [Betaproteobacteria bacterium]|nr:hypothetical protein [Betaproteobacteria bacterium]
MHCVDLPTSLKAAAPVGKTERIVGGEEERQRSDWMNADLQYTRLAMTRVASQHHRRRAARCTANSEPFRKAA